MKAFLTTTVETAPAGGAATADIVLATAGATVLTLAVLALGWAHRAGRITFLRRLGRFAEARSGLPAWAALPGAIAGVALIVAVFGMYWDISLHIDNGRDAGPLANPAHYFILAGLFGIFVAGFLAVILPEGRPGRTAVRIIGDWYAPVGGVVLLACSSFALLAFPLDDLWHRFFGQDVTLWGPTHLMMIGGAGLSLLGMAALLSEGAAERWPNATPRPLADRLLRFRYATVAGALLIGLSTFQAEFDFGVPQFRLLFEPVLIAAAAGIALVAARIYAGRGGALFAAAFFVAVRGGLALLVGPILGQSVPHLPVYLAEALLVEGVALGIAPRERPYAFGAAAGALIGTAGFAAEYGWSHLWMPVAWPSTLIGEAVPVVPLAAIAAGLVGAFVGASLAAPRARGGVARVPVVPAVAGLAIIVAVFAYGLRTNHEQGVSAAVRLTTAHPAPARTVNADVRISPASAASDADWLSAIAWQGGGLVLEDLEQVAPGEYRTSEPLPVHGSWKAEIRLHRGDSLLGVPVYMPRDTAIPAPGVPARPSFTRPFVPDHQILQREQRSDVPAALPLIGYGTVGSIALALIVALGWALRRLAASASGEGGTRATARGRRRAGVSFPAPGGAA
jgi:hypothetical protein